MPESKGRPGSAGQRPTGGDKAVATQKKQYFRRKKVRDKRAAKRATAAPPAGAPAQPSLEKMMTESPAIMPGQPKEA